VIRSILLFLFCAGLTQAAVISTNYDPTALHPPADPNDDRIIFWDDSDGNFLYLDIGSNLSITATTLNASGDGGDGGDVNDVNEAHLDDIFGSVGLLKRTGEATYGVVTDNSSNWDTAYGWGDHSSLYLAIDLIQP